MIVIKTLILPPPRQCIPIVPVHARRTGHGVASLKGTLYIGEGFDSSNSPLISGEMYDAAWINHLIAVEYNR